MFVYILEGFGTFWNLLEKGGRIWISIWDWNWIWVKSGVEIEFELNLKVSEVFKKNCFGTPCYLTVVSGGSFFLGGNNDTRRCFLRCLQVSSNSSLLFNIVFGSAVRIMSFSVRHRSHALPPLENACPYALIDQFTK